MNDQRALLEYQDAHLDKVAGSVPTQEQRDVVMAGIVRDGDDVAQGVADVVIGDVMAVSTGSDGRLRELQLVSIP